MGTGGVGGIIGLMRVIQNRRWWIWGALVAVLALPRANGRAEIFGPAGAEKRAEEKAEPTLGDRTAEAAKRVDEENQRNFGKDGDYLVRPGVLANRKEKRVKLSGRATGISEHDPVEFFAIPMDSGKDYESMSVVFARPSDVHAALEFIGMKPGRPVNYAKAHFWPKGERVTMTFEWDEPGEKDGEAKARQVAAEELIVDRRHRPAKPLPKLGLVFVGSYMIAPEDGSKPIYGADVSDSKSIASDFNDPSTVLDVPHQWVKGQVYGALKPNPAYRFAAGQAVTLTIRPEKREGARVVDLVLEVGPGAEKGLAKAKFVLTDAQGKAVTEQATLVHALAHFEKLAAEKRDPFVTVKANEKLTLGEVKELFNLIKQMDSSGGIRVEAPPVGQLFYRAFFPEEEWRDRDKRLGRPWELHLKKEGKLKGELILPADAIDDNQGRGDLKFAVGTAEEVAKVLAEKSDRWSRTVYIFADGGVGYGELLGFIGPAMKTHETVYVFLGK